MFEKVKKTRIYETIALQIKARIDSGELRRGDMLPSEADLAEQFGISRGSIREALRMLEMLGLVESQTGKRTIVTGSLIDTVSENLKSLGEVDSSEAMHLHEIRCIIEPGVAALAAMRASEEDIAQMQEYLKEMRRAMEAGAPGFVCQDLANKFHQAIASSVGNPILSDILEMLWDVLEDVTAIVYGQQERVDDSYYEHSRILEGIEKGMPELASSAMQYHLAKVEESLRAEGILQSYGDK